jgi:ATP-dependent Lon protease
VLELVSRKPRKTVSGLVKLIYPNGELSKDEVAELTELALEGRRRVKEQLKKMGSLSSIRPRSH